MVRFLDFLAPASALRVLRVRSAEPEDAPQRGVRSDAQRDRRDRRRAAEDDRSAARARREAAREADEQARRPPDPFATLAVQTQLTALARTLRTVQDDPHAYGLAERVAALQLAYDVLLVEACRLAGVDAGDLETDRRATAGQAAEPAAALPSLATTALPVALPVPAGTVGPADHHHPFSRLAGSDPLARLYAEAELAERGWTW